MPEDGRPAGQPDKGKSRASAQRDAQSRPSNPSISSRLAASATGLARDAFSSAKGSQASSTLTSTLSEKAQSGSSNRTAADNGAFENLPPSHESRSNLSTFQPGNANNSKFRTESVAQPEIIAQEFDDFVEGYGLQADDTVNSPSFVISEGTSHHQSETMQGETELRPELHRFVAATQHTDADVRDGAGLFLAWREEFERRMPERDTFDLAIRRADYDMLTAKQKALEEERWYALYLLEKRQDSLLWSSRSENVPLEDVARRNTQKIFATFKYLGFGSTDLVNGGSSEQLATDTHAEIGADVAAIESRDGLDVVNLLNTPGMLNLGDDSIIPRPDLVPQTADPTDQDVADLFGKSMHSSEYTIESRNAPNAFRPQFSDMQVDLQPKDTDTVSDAIDRERFLQLWDRVLGSYTDDVWGSDLSYVHQARKQIKDIKEGQSKQGVTDNQAIRRLQSVVQQIKLPP